jgi:hypothetical protein
MSEMAIYQQPSRTLADIDRKIAFPLRSSSVTNAINSSGSRCGSEVVLSWPTPLSADSIEDQKAGLKIMERKITRSTVEEKGGGA